MGIEAAIFVGDEHNAPELVGRDQETQLLAGRFLLAVRGKMTGQAGRTSGTARRS